MSFSSLFVFFMPWVVFLCLGLSSISYMEINLFRLGGFECIILYIENCLFGLGGFECIILHIETRLFQLGTFQYIFLHIENHLLKSGGTGCLNLEFRHPFSIYIFFA